VIFHYIWKQFNYRAGNFTCPTFEIQESSCSVMKSLNWDSYKEDKTTAMTTAMEYIGCLKTGLKVRQM
jgi:hypothetical protein